MIDRLELDRVVLTELSTCQHLLVLVVADMANGSVKEVIADNEQSLLELVTDLSFLDSVRPLNKTMFLYFKYLLSRALKGLSAS